MLIRERRIESKKVQPLQRSVANILNMIRKQLDHVLQNSKKDLFDLNFSDEKRNKLSRYIFAIMFRQGLIHLIESRATSEYTGKKINNSILVCTAKKEKVGKLTLDYLVANNFFRNN